jgi:hypothetical protein
MKYYLICLLLFSIPKSFSNDSYCGESSSSVKRAYTLNDQQLEIIYNTSVELIKSWPSQRFNKEDLIPKAFEVLEPVSIKVTYDSVWIYLETCINLAT